MGLRVEYRTELYFHAIRIEGNALVMCFILPTFLLLV